MDVTIERDSDGRIQAITVHGGEETAEGLAASVLVDASLLTLREYLHLAPGVKVESGGRQMVIDRSDLFLDREIDAVLEVVLRGLRTLKQQRPESLELRDASMDVKV
ncbi:MAG: hypothetical protein R6U88_05625 [Candidatus Bipolaricaulota bacterium]